MQGLSYVLAAPMLAKLSTYRQGFGNRDLFRHVVMEDFFQSDFQRGLLSEFPQFESGDSKNEQGEAGGKSTVEEIRELGPAFRALDDCVKSAVFLSWLGDLSGIPDLLYDPQYFGGGTHENKHGQELDTHVDFNRHPQTAWHRRLNLIIYLNEAWQESWGGCLQLRKNPRIPYSEDSSFSILPSMNRAVLFETTRWSWHGFTPIDLPPENRNLSRKSVALYFYTQTRPEEELSTTHSTIYVDRELPSRFATGLTLTDEDTQQLNDLITRRDGHIRRLYQEKDRINSQLEWVLSSRLLKLYRALRRFIRWPRT